MDNTKYKAAMSALTVPLLVSALSPSPYMDMMPRFRSRGRPPTRFFSCPMCGAKMDAGGGDTRCNG